MILLFKKLICFSAAIILLLSFNALALTEITIKPEGEFYEYSPSGDNKNITDVLKMSNAELQNYCKSRNVVYLAVNKSNSRQIRLTASVTDYSNIIINLSNMSDEKINALMPEITGDGKIKGEIVLKDGQKFIKTVTATADSGGDYSVVQYITIAEKKVYVLSFYTGAGQSTDYIETTFNSFSSPYFVSDESVNKNTRFQYVIIISAVLLLTASAYIIYTLIRDIKASKNTDTDDEQNEE